MIAKYRVVFRDAFTDDIYMVVAKNVDDSSVGFGFVRVTDFELENQSPIIDPNADAFKIRFKDTRALHISLYMLMSIEEIADDAKLDLSEERAKNVVLLRPEPST